MKNQLALFCLVVISFIAARAHAESLGEIVSVTDEGIISFYIGDIRDIKPDEELRIVDSVGQSNVFIKVRSAIPPYAEAEVSRVQITPFGFIEQIHPGQIVKVAVENKNLKSFGFMGGASFAPTSGNFGGTNYFVGLSVAGFFTQDYFWSLRLQADSLGNDGFGTEKRRSAYMFGAGYSRNQFNAFAHLGIVDTMTINDNQTHESYDPFTGTTTVSGVQHGDDFGYQLSASYSYFLKRVSRNDKFGWSLAPIVSYTDVFKSTPYKGYFSVGLEIAGWFD